MKKIIGTPEELSRILWSLEKEKKYELNEYRKKRSLDQNSYMWELINQIANELRKSKEEVYEDLLFGYGQISSILMLSSINPQGYFKYYRKSHEIKSSGVLYTEYRIAKGSSEMDTKEMTILLDGVIQEAKQLGIETLPPNQLAELRRIENEIS